MSVDLRVGRSVRVRACVGGRGMSLPASPTLPPLSHTLQLTSRLSADAAKLSNVVSFHINIIVRESIQALGGLFMIFREEGGHPTHQLPLKTASQLATP